jgi:hypothetical protein
MYYFLFKEKAPLPDRFLLAINRYLQFLLVTNLLDYNKQVFIVM